jgi:hypothetical protein
MWMILLFKVCCEFGVHFLCHCDAGFIITWTRGLHQCTLKGHVKVIIVYTTKVKASPSEWNNQQEEGGKSFGGVFKIHPSSITKDLYFKYNF